MSTRRHPRRDGEQRYIAERQLQAAETAIESAVRQAMSDWLDAARQAILYTLALNQPGLTAAGFHQYTPAASDAILATYGGWRTSLDSTVLPEVEVAFGEAFNAVRKSSQYSAYRWQQEYIAEVRDRLVIWPEGAWEDIRPEIEEALAEGESLEQIKDRIGRVLNIDAATRELRADINEVDKALADPNTDPADIPELKQRRRDLWAAHDDSLGEWEWLARRIARTEAHGAREGGALAAAQAMEIATGDKHYKRWLSTDDLRTRVTHRVADGQMVPLASPFMVGGWPLQSPGDPNGPGHEVINCRCSLMIYDEQEVQEELQGPDGSIGEVYPGGMRLGPDDPDAARAAAEALAEERGENPGKDRRADPSVLQAVQPARQPKPPVVAPEHQRGQPIPDLADVDSGELTDMMDRAYDAENWELFDAIESELTRRDAADDSEDDAEERRRTQEWLDAENDWRQQVTDWLDAETQWQQAVTGWLDAEQQWLDDPLPGLAKRAIPSTRDLATIQGKLLDAAEVITRANPEYASAKRWQVNCQRCVQSAELRHRGYDVIAAPNDRPSPTIAPSNWSPQVLDAPVFQYPLTDTERQRLAKSWYPNRDGFDNQMREQIAMVNFADLWRERDGSARPFTPASSKKKLLSDLEQLPAWSRGWVTIRWKGGSAHIFSFQVREDPFNPGKTTIRFMDPQTGNMDVADYLNRASPHTPMGWMRVDDLMPTEAVRGMVGEA